MATSNTSEQYLFQSPNSIEQIETNVDLRHRLGISEMGNSQTSPTKRNSSKHYYQGIQRKIISFYRFFLYIGNYVMNQLARNAFLGLTMGPEMECADLAPNEDICLGLGFCPGRPPR